MNPSPPQNARVNPNPGRELVTRYFERDGKVGLWTNGKARVA